MPSLVVIEDEILLARQIARALESDGHEVRTAGTCREGLQLVLEAPPDLALVDLRLPDGSGLDLLSQFRDQASSTAVILMTALGSVNDAVEAMRRGAADYLQKPLDLDEVKLLVARVVERQRSERELSYHRERNRAEREGIIGEHPALVEIFEAIERLAGAALEPAKRPPILLTGETGTGKGVLARAFHGILGGGPFIEVNCTAMPATLVEAELFGHERGTFTDAKATRTGLFEAAEGGTVFLDEIGHASTELQAKLLKVIEDRRVRRLGSNRDRPVNVHVIAATNRDLDTAVDSGEFRRDLLHRLRVLSFEIPPLRDRGDDVVLIARHFCREFARTYGREIDLDEGSGHWLRSYPWPGNIRELHNVIERAVLLEPGDRIGAGVLARLLDAQEPVNDAAFALPADGIDLGQLERDLIRQALERTEGNRTRAASLLGLSRDTLRYRLEKFGLE